MTLEQTQRRRQAVETIHDVVSAMRAIAAGRIQHAQKALAAARRYAAVVHRAVAAIEDEQTQLDWPAADGRVTLIVLTSEQPLCGSFNHDVLDLAERRWNELRQQSSVWLVVVGHRGGRQLAARGIRADHAEAAANSLAGPAHAAQAAGRTGEPSLELRRTGNAARDLQPLPVDQRTDSDRGAHLAARPGGLAKVGLAAVLRAASIAFCRKANCWPA